MTAEAEGTAVAGRVYYSNGSSGANHPIKLRDFTRPTHSRCG